MTSCLEVLDRPLRAAHIATGGGEAGSAIPGAVPADRSKFPLTDRTILLVEDDFFVGLEIAQFIESLGGEVLGPFATTAAARNAIDGDGCDGALLDVNLGREDSLGLARELRGSGIPILFVTAHVDDESLFTDGLSDAPRIGKPVSRAVLRRRAAALFGN